MFFDLIGDALKQASQQLEKSVDNALGIEGDGKDAKTSDSLRTPGATDHPEDAGVREKTGSSTSVSTKIAERSQTISGSNGLAGATHESAAPVKKKVIKKVVKKVLKSAASSSAGTLAAIEPDEQGAGPKSDPPHSTHGPNGAHKTATPSQPTPLTAAEAESTTAGALEQLESAADSGWGDLDMEPDVPAAPIPETGAGDVDVTSSSASHTGADSYTAPSDPGPHHPSMPSHTVDDRPDVSSSDLASTTLVRGSHSQSAPHHEHHDPSRDAAGNVHASALTTSQSPSRQPKPNPQATAASPSSSTITTAPAPAPGSRSKPSTGGASTTHPREHASTTAHHAEALATLDVPGHSSSFSLDGVDSMGEEQLRELARKMFSAVEAREQQLFRQAQQMSDMQQVVAQLQEKNEELGLQKARISEKELEDMRAEFEHRLGAADRKVYALTKERDALKRGNEKLADYGALLREKDGIIKQVMEEGEKLSTKQFELEAVIKKLRNQVKDLEGERDKLASKLSAEEGGAEALRRAKAKAERDLAAAVEASRAELEASRHAMEAALAKARSDQTEAEERVREVAAAGLAKRLRDAETRCEALSETVVELREALDRQRQAADLREEMLKQDVADLERRCQAAELRHQELTSKMPEATRPLLRQIEAMQATADAQADAWAAAERTLNARITDAESRAAMAVERERLTSERTQVLHSKVTALDAALSAARGEVKAAHAELETSRQLQLALHDQVKGAQQAAELANERNHILVQQLEQLDAQHADALAAERSNRIAAESDAAMVRKECERRIEELEVALAESQGGHGAREPPAMAAPGYKWILVREGEHHHPPHDHRRHPASLRDTSTDGVAAGVADAASGPSIALHKTGSGFGGSTACGEEGMDLLSNLTPAASSSAPLASEMEAMRATLRIKSGEVASLEAQVRELEATRDRLAEELVVAAQASSQAADMMTAMEDLKQDFKDIQNRYVAAVELLGERDESLEELRADLMDVKNLYREQIEFMVVQLAQVHQNHTHLQQHQQPSQHIQQTQHTGPAPG